MLFVGVNGQHSHEVDSPSFFNPEEVCLLKSLSFFIFIYFFKFFIFLSCLLIDNRTDFVFFSL